MSFRGMDPDRVDQLAGRIRLQVDAMESVIGVVDRAVAGLAGAWHGDDLHDFAAGWHQAHRPRAHAASMALAGWVAELQAHVAGQRATSDGVRVGVQGVTQMADRGARSTGAARPFDVAGGALTAFSAFNFFTTAVGLVGDLYDTAKKVPWADKFPHGSYLSAGLRGVGLGEGVAGLITGIRAHDAAGTIGSAADTGFALPFVSAPVSALWTGLKIEVGFFIPLDAQAQDDHLEWMHDQGFTPDQITQRYSGAQGLINLGNDNVERHAPWMNRIADVAMQKPAEWLYDVGIKL